MQSAHFLLCHTMNVVQFKSDRILKLAVIALILLLVRQWRLQNLYLSRPKRFPSNPRNADSHKKSVHVPGQSYPNDLPIFLGARNLGNFEPSCSEKITISADPGENGKAHHAKKPEADNINDIYGYNRMISDEISLNRTIQDLREEECQYWHYPAALPNVTVILVFYNEGFSTLFRTIHSILNRTPMEYLEEILLVDDNSDNDELKQRLDSELTKPMYNGIIRLFRNQEREGLIRSRNIGAQNVSSEVVVFLDSHVEVGYNWLPPLLAPIHADKTTVAVSMTDNINKNDFSVTAGEPGFQYNRGLFDWSLKFQKKLVNQEEELRRKYNSEPFYSPVYSGIFAINRDWFQELGWYDPDLWIWGGEDFELSFKIWMCGGNIVGVPCSRVAHLNRDIMSINSNIVKVNYQPLPLRNYKRIVETWFDEEYKELFYTKEPLARIIDMGDISDRLAIKVKLDCKSFDWFIKEVASDVLELFPKPPPNRYWGELKNEAASKLCLDSSIKQQITEIGTTNCHGQGGQQLFRLNLKGQLATGDWCLEPDIKKGDSVIGALCSVGSVSGQWKYIHDEKQLYHIKQRKCLTMEPSSKKPILRDCDQNNAYHKWIWKQPKPIY